MPFVAESDGNEGWTADRVRDRARQLVHQAGRHRVEELTRRSLTHRSLWEHLSPVVDSAAGTRRMEIGRSVEGRTLYAVDFGHGPVRVVLWSQMHGDEPTATLALAPPHEPNRSDMPTRTRAKQLAAVMRLAADSLVDGRVTRYDNAYNGQAFGDAMQSWGTSTVLVETGSWEGDADKEYLRQVNFVLLLVALDAIATGSFEHADVREYDSLPGNRANTGR